MTTTPSVPIEDLRPTPSTEQTAAGLQLVGSRCTDCGARAFPARTRCYRCGSGEVHPGGVGRTGILYSWTTVHVSSTRPTPYSVGYVDLADLRVFGQLVEDPSAPAATGSHRWQIGDQVTTVAVPGGWAFTRQGGR